MPPPVALRRQGDLKLAPSLDGLGWAQLLHLVPCLQASDISATDSDTVEGRTLSNPQAGSFESMRLNFLNNSCEGIDLKLTPPSKTLPCFGIHFVVHG